jgi:selenocysteine lyase/cysteine desulfurase
LHKFFNLSKGSVRLSLYIYNTIDELTVFREKLGNIAKTFG